jgi:hypothetical protein
MSIKGKQQINPYLSPEARQLLKTYCVTKGVTESSVVEAALREYFTDARDSVLLMRRLDRNDRNVERARRDTELVAELLASFVRVWYAHTPALLPSEKDAAQRSARLRYEQLLDHVGERIKGGRGLTVEAVLRAVADTQELAAAAAAPVPAAGSPP